MSVTESEITSPTQSGTDVDLARLERLVILIEESSEVIKNACKAIRFGLDSKNPLLGPGSLSNRDNLEIEIGDFNNAVRMLTAAGDIRRDRIKVAQAVKREMISYWVGKQPKKVL